MAREALGQTTASMRRNGKELGMVVRRRIWSIVLVAILILVAVRPTPEVVATTASGAPFGLSRFAASTLAAAGDLQSEFPQGVAVTPLVETVSETAPDAPVVFRLDDLQLGPGWSLDQQAVPGPLLFLVTQGELTVVDELGIEGVYRPDDQLVIPPDALFALRNDGEDPVRALLLGLYTEGNEPPEILAGGVAEGSPVAEVGTPVAESELAVSVLRTTIEQPVLPAHLFLARLTWEPETDLGEHTFTGPVGFIGESGVLAITGPSGIEGQLRPGKAVLFPAATANRQRNTGTENAVVLMAGITGADLPLIEGGTPVAATPGTGETGANATETAGTVDTSGNVPMFRGNAARTGEMPGPGPEGAPVLRWSVHLSEWVVSSPAVVDGVVFVGKGSTTGVIALDAATGETIWEFNTSTAVRTSPAVFNGMVFIGTESPALFAIDAATGDARWTFETVASLLSSPVVADGTVFAGDQGGMLYAIDAATGAEKWRFQTDVAVRSSPAVAKGTVYVGSAGGILHALDAATGAEKWRFEIGEGTASSPAVAGDVVYIGSAAGNLHAVDTQSGAELWRFQAGGKIVSSPAVANGVVYLASTNGNVHALNTVNGAELWRFETGGQIRSSPAVVSGVLYISSSSLMTETNSPSGLLYAFDAGTGVEQWRFEIHDGASETFNSSPAVAGGFVYIGSNDGNLYAIGGEAGDLAVTPTPQPIVEGATVEVIAEGAVIRAAPSSAGVVIAEVPVGTRLQVSGPSEKRNGKVWWKVEDAESGNAGYMSAEFLRVV